MPVATCKLDAAESRKVSKANGAFPRSSGRVVNVNILLHNELLSKWKGHKTKVVGEYVLSEVLMVGERNRKKELLFGRSTNPRPLDYFSISD